MWKRVIGGFSAFHKVSSSPCSLSAGGHLSAGQEGHKFTFLLECPWAPQNPFQRFGPAEGINGIECCPLPQGRTWPIVLNIVGSKLGVNKELLQPYLFWVPAIMKAVRKTVFFVPFFGLLGNIWVATSWKQDARLSGSWTWSDLLSYVADGAGAWVGLLLHL